MPRRHQRLDREGAGLELLARALDQLEPEAAPQSLVACRVIGVPVRHQ